MEFTTTNNLGQEIGEGLKNYKEASQRADEEDLSVELASIEKKKRDQYEKSHPAYFNQRFPIFEESLAKRLECDTVKLGPNTPVEANEAMRRLSYSLNSAFNGDDAN